MPESEKELNKLFILLEQANATEGMRTSLTINGLVRYMRGNGMSDEAILDEIVSDLRSDKSRWFGEWQRNVLKNTLGGANRAAGIGSELEITKDREGDRTESVWITVHDKRVCPDCISRHGQVRSMAEWRIIGLPRSGWSICGGSCRCQLVPSTEETRSMKAINTVAEMLTGNENLQ